MNEKVKISANGHIEAFIRKDGKDEVVVETHNELQGTATTVIANALAGDKGITHVYFIYTNASSPSSIGASGGDLTAAGLQALASSSVGIIKAPVFSMGMSASDSIIDTANFVAVTDTADHLSGLSWADGLKVYALGLVQQTTAGIDVLYAAADITPIQKAANAQVGVRWKTTIAID